jgi:MoaA/NifB/PqqE/SkfB family radical SAM enzyme
MRVDAKAIRKIRVDASTVCQLKCPCCSNSAGKIAKTLRPGFLRAENLDALLAKAPHVKSVELSSFGEVFLNPFIKDIIETAARRGARCVLNGGVNLNTLSEGAAEAVVRHGVESMRISIDGVSQESYGQYRRGGSIRNVFANIAKINRWKRELKAGLPKLNWQYVVFGHNEHELEAAVEMAREMDMEIVFKRNNSAGYSPVKDAEKVNRITGWRHSTTKDDERRTKRHGCAHSCLHVFGSPQFNWDGRLTGCAFNYRGPDMGGNGFDPAQSFDDLVNASAMVESRLAVMGRAEPGETSPCLRCPVYDVFRANGSWITDRDAERALVRPS